MTEAKKQRNLGDIDPDVLDAQIARIHRELAKSPGDQELLTELDRLENGEVPPAEKPAARKRSGRASKKATK